MSQSQSLVRPGLTAAVQRRGVSRRIAKETSRAIEQIAGQAMVYATQVEAGAWLAHNAMQLLEDLTEQEMEAVTKFPQRAARFQVIADAYANLAVNALRQMDS